MTPHAPPPPPTVAALTGTSVVDPPGTGGSAGSGPARAAGDSTGTSDPAGGSVRFVTGDAVSLDLPVAQLGSRMLARMIDLVVQVVLFVGLLFLVQLGLGLLGAYGVVVPDDSLFSGVMTVLTALVVVGYPVTMEALAGGRTLGKLALGLRVVRDDGGPVRFRQAATRGLVGAAVEFPGLVAPPLTWLAGVWTMVVSPRARRLGDHAAGTLVVHDRAGTRRPRFPLVPPALAGWAVTLDLAGLDDALALTVRHFLHRAPELREPARSRLAVALMAEVAAVTRPAPPPGVHPAVYLAAVHAERHHRAARRLFAVRGRTAVVWPELVHPPRPAPRPTRRRKKRPADR